MDRLHAELGNLRRALAWAGELPADGARVTLGLRTCVAGAAYWRMRHNNAEGIVALDRLLLLVDPLMPGGTATALTLASIPADVVAFARTQAMGLRGAPGTTTQPAWIHPMLDGAIAHFRAVGDRRGEGRALMQLASYLGYFRDHAPESRETALAAALAATAAGDTPTGAFAHCLEGSVFRNSSFLRPISLKGMGWKAGVSLKMGESARRVKSPGDSS